MRSYGAAVNVEIWSRRSERARVSAPASFSARDGPDRRDDCRRPERQRQLHRLSSDLDLTRGIKQRTIQVPPSLTAVQPPLRSVNDHCHVGYLGTPVLRNTRVYKYFINQCISAAKLLVKNTICSPRIYSENQTTVMMTIL